MSRAEEMKFQVELARIQVKASIIVALGISLTATGIGIFVTIPNLQASVALSALLVSVFLMISGFVIYTLFLQKIQKQLGAKMKDAEKIKDEIPPVSTTTPTDNKNQQNPNS